MSCQEGGVSPWFLWEDAVALFEYFRKLPGAQTLLLGDKQELHVDPLIRRPYPQVGGLVVSLLKACPASPGVEATCNVEP